MANSYKQYPNFNSVTFTGRVTDVTKRSGKNGEFIVVSMITNLTDSKSVTVKFLDSGDIFKLYANAKLPVGRMITVTGSLDNVSEFYVDKDGNALERKRPEITLAFVTILRGGLGALPKNSEAPVPTTRRIVQLQQSAASTPVEDITPEEEYADNAAPLDEIPAVY